MNRESRQKVKDYLRGPNVNSIEPLKFLGYGSPKDEFNPEKYSVEDMVKRTLWLTEKHYSENSETNYIETRPGRWRSSLDIWRHIRYYYPKVSIYMVMRAIYNISKDLGGQYCNTISRRTFRIKGCEEGSEYWNNYQGEIDEYKLRWNEWEDI